MWKCVKLSQWWIVRHTGNSILAILMLKNERFGQKCPKVPGSLSIFGKKGYQKSVKAENNTTMPLSRSARLCMAFSAVPPINYPVNNSGSLWACIFALWRCVMSWTLGVIRQARPHKYANSALVRACPHKSAIDPVEEYGILVYRPRGWYPHDYLIITQYRRFVNISAPKKPPIVGGSLGVCDIINLGNCLSCTRGREWQVPPGAMSCQQSIPPIRSADGSPNMNTKKQIISARYHIYHTTKSAICQGFSRLFYDILQLYFIK